MLFEKKKRDEAGMGGGERRRNEVAGHERIVLIYSNVFVVRVGGYRYRIWRECNGETLQRMRTGGGREGVISEVAKEVAATAASSSLPRSHV